MNPYEYLELVTVTCSVYKPTSLGDHGVLHLSKAHRAVPGSSHFPVPVAQNIGPYRGWPGPAVVQRLLIGGRDLGREISARLRNRMINM